MKKNIKFYIAFWLVLVIVFNVIAFVSPGWIGVEKYTASYWCGYIFITVAFIVNLVFAVMALYTDDQKKIFYNIAFLRANYAGLIFAFIAGGTFMLVPGIPYWVCILISVIEMGANILLLIKTRAVAKIVTDIDVKVAKNAHFMKGLTADLQSLLSVAKDEKTRQLVQKVYEEARYSDPVSSEQLTSVEQKIEIALDTFITAVSTESDEVESSADTLLYLIKNRNEKCKVLK